MLAQIDQSLHMHVLIPFKINHNGQKLQVRIQADEEEITDKSLHCYFLYGVWSMDQIGRVRWRPSQKAGDLVKDYDPKRIYLEVLSKFYKA